MSLCTPSACTVHVTDPVWEPTGGLNCSCRSLTDRMSAKAATACAEGLALILIAVELQTALHVVSSCVCEHWSSGCCCELSVRLVAGLVEGHSSEVLGLFCVVPNGPHFVLISLTRLLVDTLVRLLKVLRVT